MAEFYQTLFLLQFVLAFGILVTKLFNLMLKAKLYSIAISILLFIGYFFLYVIGFLTILINPTDLLLVQLFQLETWVISLNVIFFLAEIFFLFLLDHEKESFGKEPYFANRRE